MSQNKPQPVIIDGIKFPVDLSPLVRARMKLISHFVVIAVFNAVLTALTLINQNTVITWQMVLISVGSQASLALLDALRKYYSASGDLPMSMLINLAINSIASRAPSVQFNQAEQAAQQAISNQFQPLPSSNVPQVQPVQVSVAPSLSIPVVQPNPSPTYPSLDNVVTVNTLPNIGIVKPQ